MPVSGLLLDAGVGSVDWSLESSVESSLLSSTLLSSPWVISTTVVVSWESCMTLGVGLVSDWLEEDGVGSDSVVGWACRRRGH